MSKLTIKFASGVAEKTNPELWSQAKSQAKAKMGGTHSARAMQEAVRIYKSKGGAYKGRKPGSKNKLIKWSKEKWGYSSGKSEGKGRYRPAAIWSKLTKKEKDSLNQSKYRGNKQGKQFVPIPKKLKDKVQPSEFSWDGLILEFAKVEKEVRVKSYRTKSGSVVNPFRRRQKVNKEESDTTVKPNNLKALGIQAGIMTAALAVPLIPIGVKAARGKMSDIRIKRYQKAATKALPAPTLGKGMFASVQNISVREVGKVLDPYGPGFLNSEGRRPIKSLIKARDKEFNILNKLKDTGVAPKPGKLNEFGFTMEKIEGDTLQNFLEQALQDPTDEQLKALGSSVGGAVKKMHSAGVAHRDLHTNNIFVDKKGEIKILDFGKAATVKELDDPQKAFTSDLDTIIGHVGSYLNKKNIDGPYREVARRKRIFEESVKENYGK